MAWRKKCKSTKRKEVGGKKQDKGMRRRNGMNKNKRRKRKEKRNK
jgi:hypothetical protein